LKELRRLKERLVKLRRDAVSHQKLLQDVLPVIKSLSCGLLTLSSWLDEAGTIMASHCIGRELADVVERFDRHKVSFQCLLLLLSLGNKKTLVFYHFSLISLQCGNALRMMRE